MKAKSKGTLKGVPKTKVIGRGKTNKPVGTASARKGKISMPKKLGYKF